MTRPKPRRPRGPGEMWETQTVGGREIEVLVPLHGELDRTRRDSPGQTRQLRQFVDAFLEDLDCLGSVILLFADLRKLRLVDELRRVAPAAVDLLNSYSARQVAGLRWDPLHFQSAAVDLHVARRILAERAATDRRRSRDNVQSAITKATDLLRRSPPGSYPTLRSLAEAAGCSSPTLSKNGFAQLIADVNRSVRLDAIERGRTVAPAARGASRKSPKSCKSAG